MSEDRFKLTAEHLEAFAGIYLWSRYDEPRATPQFHRDAWAMYASDVPAIAIAAPRNHAKAQSLTSCVLTMDGWRLIGDLEVGDSVIGSDGKPTRVTDLHPISEMPLYRVTTKDGRSTLCNAEHLWKVKVPSNTGAQWLVKSTEELLPIYKRSRINGYDEYRCFLPVPKAIQWEGDAREFLVSPYVLGVWLGDGHSAGGRITSADPEIFEYFDRKVEKRSGQYLYQVEALTGDLRRIGVLGNKHVPTNYLYSTEHNRMQLLRGLMDTDGTVHQDGRIAYFCNTNAALIDAVVFLVRSLGGMAHVSEYEPTLNGKVCRMSWRVSVKFGTDVCPFQLHRKRAQWNGAEDLKLTIVDITPADPEPARCITVEASDGLYVTDDFLLTHNSTSLTHDFILANVLFRIESYVIIIGASEEKAMEHLQDISAELHNNDDLQTVPQFRIKRFLTDQKTDIVVQLSDGHEFRILARGGEQKIRGTKWKGKRPGLIVCDDLEDDEQVESRERREKFRKWFFRAAKQSMRDGGRIRVHGTILHDDALLSRLTRNKTWTSKVFKAHESFDDFSNILWPEKFSEERLRLIRQEFIEEHDAGGYSQEYLNDPLDNADRFYSREDFLPMERSDHTSNKLIIAAADMGVTKQDKYDPSAIGVAGKDAQNIMHVLSMRTGRWDQLELIDQIFAVQQRWKPDVFYIEGGVIGQMVAPMLYKEMQSRDIFINLQIVPPTKDKGVRAKSMQKRMRAGAVRWDTAGEWYEACVWEHLKFNHYAKAQRDDQVDVTSMLSNGFENLAEVEEEDFDESYDHHTMQSYTGRSPVCGY